MNRLTVYFIALLVASAASAQDWAKARLEKSPRHMEWVKIKHGEREVNSFIAYPEVKEKATVVIVIHEIFGLLDWARSVTDELAEAGYIAIAPDLLSGSTTNGGGTAELGGVDAVRTAISILPPDQITADLDAVAAYVVGQPACNGKIVVAGFCWGGGQAFRYVTNSKNIKAGFVFYGVAPNKTNEIDRIACPVYGFYGGRDARITAGVPATAALMKAAGKTYEPVTYDGAGHGFMRGGEAPDAGDADKQAHDAAWARLKELLGKI